VSVIKQTKYGWCWTLETLISCRCWSCINCFCTWYELKKGVILKNNIHFLLGWVGYGVPDWQAFRRYNGSTQEYYGLWAYCQEPAPTFSPICRRWSDAEVQLFNGSRPNFVRTAEGLITTGMVLLSLGLVAGFIAAILPLLAYLAGALLLLAFIFLVIGVPIFGRQSNNLSIQMGVASYNKRYGFWLMIPTIVLSFLAGLLFLAAGYFYQRYGFGNFATHSYSRRPYGGQQLLGPAYAIRGAPYGAAPGMGYPYRTAPSLLSQYIAQRIPRYNGPSIVRQTIVSAIPQPSIGRSLGQPFYSAPAYFKSGTPAQSAYGNGGIINLTGRTLVGPVVPNA
jgi:hypothetical protein